MKRLIDQYLLEWKDSSYRKPVLLRGARQVGKTFAIRQLGKNFEHFIEINFETDKRFRDLFTDDLHPTRIMRDIELITLKKIIPGKTLLFFDEIQIVPQALTSLRYFYEQVPEQHIIAAGSLLDFRIQQEGMPVGRVMSLYMYPLSFFEFLCACGYTRMAQELLPADEKKPLSPLIHKELLRILGEYLAIGGMPEAVERWRTTKDPRACFEVHQTLLDTYRHDFDKYAKKLQIKYLELLFREIPRQLGSKFKFSAIQGDYRKRELAPCLQLLSTAGIAHEVMRSAGNGVPLGAEASPEDYKVVFLDIALCQSLLGIDLAAWFLQPQQEFINKGPLVEAFAGQEFLTYADPKSKAHLFYWQRNVKGSEAEIDYLVQEKAHIVPIEVKSGPGTTLKSMHLFLEHHPQSSYGIRFSTQEYSVHDKIYSYPLYAIAEFVLKNRPDEIKKYQSLTEM